MAGKSSRLSYGTTHHRASRRRSYHSWKNERQPEFVLHRIRQSGSPTHGGKATAAITDFLNTISPSRLADVKVAAFDTRLSAKFVGIFGYAAGKIMAVLGKKGATGITSGAAGRSAARRRSRAQAGFPGHPVDPRVQGHKDYRPYSRPQQQPRFTQGARRTILRSGLQCPDRAHTLPWPCGPDDDRGCTVADRGHDSLHRRSRGYRPRPWGLPSKRYGSS